MRKKYPSLEGVCGDAAYRKTFEIAMEALGLTVDIVERIQGAGWMILPKRWCVERSFGWMGGSHRLSKDFEILPCTVENIIYISYASTLLNRLLFIKNWFFMSALISSSSLFFFY